MKFTKIVEESMKKSGNAVINFVILSTSTFENSKFIKIRYYFHGKMLILYNIGIWDKIYIWFENYLYDRKQCEYIENSVSSTKNNNCGVPKGLYTCSDPFFNIN